MSPPPEPSPDAPPPPRQRPRRRPAGAPGRCSVYDLRRASGLSWWVRVAQQTDRDVLVHRLGAIDQRLLGLSTERRHVVGALAALRDELYPPVPWAHGRRPPDVDCPPLPPAPEGARSLTGRDLRVTCLGILRRHGPLPLRELHGLLHRYGYLVGARRPVTALSDAMAYEVERGRARRIERGRYAATDAPPQRHRTPPPLALDPDLDEDPGTWTGSTGS